MWLLSSKKKRKEKKQLFKNVGDDRGEERRVIVRVNLTVPPAFVFFRDGHISQILHLLVHFGAMTCSCAYEIILKGEGRKNRSGGQKICFFLRKEAIGDSNIRCMKLSLKPY